MAKKSKATKAVIASLVATSAIVPAIAVSADEAVTTSVETTSAEVTSVEVAQQIDFKVSDTTGQLARYFSGPGLLHDIDGQYFIEVELDETTLGMLTSATVDGETVITETGVLIPVSEDFAPVKIDLEVNSLFGAMKSVATLTPDADSITEVGGEEETEEPTETEEEPVKVFEQGPEFGQIEDGEYEVAYDAYKTDDGSNTGNYAAITRHFEPGATLTVEDGVYYVTLTPTEASAAMIAGLKVAGEEVAFDEETGTYTFAIESLSGLYESSVHVVVAAANMDKWRDFGFALETADLELPEVEEEAEATTLPLHVYKEGTNEYSLMQNLYTDDEVTITATETGYDVQITFPQGQHMKEFIFEGATVAVTEEYQEGDNTVQVYTVSVDDLSKIYKATADLKVMLNGQVLYETAHDFDVQFGGKKNPFTDIAKASNAGAIVQLYSAGIFKEAEKFNPANAVKRAQFALMLQRALELDVPATTKFTDIAGYNEEAQNAIKALNNFGIINGKTETTFAPDQDITRKQAALMIYRLLEKSGYEGTDATAPFADVVATNDAEFIKAAAALNELGIMTGNNGAFKPADKLTRNQMAKVLNNALQVVQQ